ncbi:MAG TPA: hypothetical protein VIM11_26010 [Tepidisphaeraceae bacterium]|jgi:hypothetical protein
MKWRKRLLLLVLFVVVFAAALGGCAWWMARGEPEWYSRLPMDPQELEAAANRAERQLQRTLNWAQDQQAFAASSARGAPTTHPSKAIEVTFTQDELNGFFRKWDSTFGWSSAYSAYISQPQIALRDGRLLAAATVTDLGSVLSVEIVPRLEGGKLRVSIGRILAGRLPLPASFYAGYRKHAEAAMNVHLPAWRAGAEIGPQGGANLDTVAAAMGELLIDMLHEQPAPPVLFLPYSMQSKPKSLPVKVTAFRIEGKTLTMTVEPLDAPDRAALLEEIRSPKSDPTADSVAP